MSNRLRIGALGNSRILKRFIQNPEISVNGCIDVVATRSNESATLARESYPNKLILIGYEAVLERQDLDAIYISLPPGLHFQWAKKSLEAGKHVLVEKPAVLNVHEAKILQEIAQENKLILMEAWWYRFHPLIHSLRQLIASDSLGAIKFISSNFSYINSDPSDSRWKSELGGGALYDMFSYHVDFLNYVMGISNQNVELIQAFSRVKYEVDACVSAELVTYDGTVCNLMAGLDRPSLCKTFIVGERGSIEIPHIRVMPEFQESSFIHFTTSGGKSTKFAQVNAYALMMDAFAIACLEGRDSPVPIEETLQNTQLLERVKLAMHE